MAGWEVLEAGSAERALELMHREEPCDAALLDIMLPGMDGLSLCETIRPRQQRHRHHHRFGQGAGRSDKIRGLSIGADGLYHQAFFGLRTGWPGWRR